MAIDTTPSEGEFPVRPIKLRYLKDENIIQLRCQTSVTHAKAITEFILKRGPISEPIVIFEDPDFLGLYRVADGAHRVMGYRKAAMVDKRFDQVMAEIRPGGRKEAFEFAAQANQDKTYMKRTTDDIRNIILKLLEEFPDWNLRPVKSLASHIGASFGFASKTISLWRDQNKVEKPEFVENFDGKRCRTSNPSVRPGEIPRINKDDRGRLYSCLGGKREYLGRDKEQAEAKLRDLVSQTKKKMFTYNNSANIDQYLTYRGIISKTISPPCQGSNFPGLYGRHVGTEVTFTWEPFEYKAEWIRAAYRALWCQKRTGAKRAVVLCPTDLGPAEMMAEATADFGIEWMTIEDFVASLKGEGEPTSEAS